MSKHDTQHAIVPRLRFPEFRDAPGWKLTPLSRVLEYERPDRYIVTDTNYLESGTPVLTANKSFIIGYTDETDGIFEDVPVIIFDDFTTDKKYVDFPFKVKSSAIKILKSRGNDQLKLVYELMTGIRFDPTQHKRYYISEYQHLDISLPKEKEQQKIADCLGSLDDLIAAEGRKLVALRDHKQALMQQLFPREGETQPRLRFPEFQGDEDWTEANLGELAEIVRGGSPRPIDDYLTSDPDGLNWLKIGDLETGAKYVTATEDRVIPDALSRTRVIEPGDLILSNSMSFGRPYLSRMTTCIHDGWIAIRKISRRVQSEYLYYAIMAPGSQAFFNDWASGGGIRNLNIDIVKNLPMSHPAPPEQDRVANCLSALDARIAAQAERLDAIRSHKRGLMQQLFPSPEAATEGSA